MAIRDDAEWCGKDRTAVFLSRLCFLYNVKITDCLPPLYFFPDDSLRTPLCPCFLSYQELSDEQARYQEMFAEVQRVRQKLQEAEAELRTARDSLSQSQEKIESLSTHLQQSESLLQERKSKGDAEVDGASASISVSSDEVHTCHTSHRDQSSESGEGRDSSVTRESAAGETQRQLSERVTELEKEVCVCLLLNVSLEL